MRFLAPLPLVLLGVAGAALAAERPKSEVTCQPTQEKLVYDCRVMLSGRNSGQPIDGAMITIHAAMPSMAMAHNVRPVTAEPTATPGMYRARLTLEMHGEWALTLDIAGPARDRLVHKLHFGTAAGMQGSGHKMDKMPKSE